METRLERLGDRVWYLPGPVNRGVVVDPSGKECLLVDTGLDAGAARHLLRAVDEQGWRVAGVLTTHAHADHFGGNRAVAARTGAPVYCPAVEAGVLRHPAWEPAYLNAGASPPAELRVKFFLAEPSPVDGTIAPGEPLPAALDGWGIEVVDLAGHSLGMVGFAADGAIFCGDAFFDAAVVDQHGIPYLVDVGRALAALRRLEAVAGGDRAWLVASHGRAYRVPQESRGQLRHNLARVEAIAAAVVAGLASGPRSEGDLLAHVCTAFGVRVANTGLYFLYRATVAAYLSYLQGQGVVRAHLDGARLLWERA